MSTMITFSLRESSELPFEGHNNKLSFMSSEMPFSMSSDVLEIQQRCSPSSSSISTPSLLHCSDDEKQKLAVTPTKDDAYIASKHLYHKKRRKNPATNIEASDACFEYPPPSDQLGSCARISSSSVATTCDGVPPDASQMDALPSTPGNSLQPENSVYDTVFQRVIKALQPGARRMHTSHEMGGFSHQAIKGVYWKYKKQKWVAEWISISSKHSRVWKTFSVSKYGDFEAEYLATQTRIEAELRGDTSRNPEPLVSPESVRVTATDIYSKMLSLYSHNNEKKPVLSNLASQELPCLSSCKPMSVDASMMPPSSSRSCNGKQKRIRKQRGVQASRNVKDTCLIGSTPSLPVHLAKKKYQVKPPGLAYSVNPPSSNPPATTVTLQCETPVKQRSLCSFTSSQIPSKLSFVETEATGMSVSPAPSSPSPSLSFLGWPVQQKASLEPPINRKCSPSSDKTQHRLASPQSLCKALAENSRRGSSRPSSFYCNLPTSSSPSDAFNSISSSYDFPCVSSSLIAPSPSIKRNENLSFLSSPIYSRQNSFSPAIEPSKVDPPVVRVLSSYIERAIVYACMNSSMPVEACRALSLEEAHERSFFKLPEKKRSFPFDTSDVSSLKTPGFLLFYFAVFKGEAYVDVETLQMTRSDGMLPGKTFMAEKSPLPHSLSSTSKNLSSLTLPSVHFALLVDDTILSEDFSLCSALRAHFSSLSHDEHSFSHLAVGMALSLFENGESQWRPTPLSPSSSSHYSPNDIAYQFLPAQALPLLIIQENMTFYIRPHPFFATFVSSAVGKILVEEAAKYLLNLGVPVDHPEFADFIFEAANKMKLLSTPISANIL
ncbi:hypothetical protein IE077_002694 [Cardiosporidium cionae]|uniref:AP2/ERF domain-containing protein n=1 Tax=Cardiosporidium cionae TaxID=476202 RepID=A0ABQ7JFJ8_9APIC|nr:hypothetical protein IE077_002694 [Cardiosporidium cionae]|eukprot:KAF8822763.1 hypothetical protein IE077_002694 [Cardiosporidium cionae]